MKHLIYLILLLPVLVKAQTIDTTYKSFPSCRVVPFLPNPRIDAIPAERVQITYSTIDFIAKTMQVSYQFCKIDGTVLHSGTVALTGIDFAAIINGVQNLKAIVFQYLGAKLIITYQ